jgi:hypothetical protein
VNIKVDIGAATAADLAKATDKGKITKVKAGESKQRLLLVLICD